MIDLTARNVIKKKKLLGARVATRPLANTGKTKGQAGRSRADEDWANLHKLCFLFRRLGEVFRSKRVDKLNDGNN